MWNWKLQCLFMIMSLCPCAPYISKNTKQLQWLDDLKKRDQMDSYFDRVVMIVLNETNNDNEVYMKTQSLIATGFFIREDTVLTSYNPFRKIIKDKGKRNSIVIAFIDHRIVKDFNVSYELDFRTIDCARQVMPMHDHESSNIWHGGKKDNSPLHDLMVIRLNENVTFTSEFVSQYSRNARIKAGPLHTELAKPNDHLDSNIKYGSAGYANSFDIWKWCCLHRTVHVDDYVERNCDKWLPKEWGHFICIDNMNNYPGIGSGAMLVSRSKLYGVGSFMLKRGGQSILVFTDVRRYYDLLFDTCSWLDQDLGVTTTTTTTAMTTTQDPTYLRT